MYVAWEKKVNKMQDGYNKQSLDAGADSSFILQDTYIVQTILALRMANL